jgi:hypothetical protein
MGESSADAGVTANAAIASIAHPLASQKLLIPFLLVAPVRGKSSKLIRVSTNYACRHPWSMTAVMFEVDADQVGTAG